MARVKRVLAGGAVVTRERGGRTEVALVHRKKYRDWSLPKGKTDNGETEPVAAVREVWEESGAQIRLGIPLDRKVYDLDKSTRKYVSWWAGIPMEVIRRAPDSEVDVVAWLPIKAALKRLSYRQDRDLVEQFMALPPTTPVIIVRHAKAMDRKDWTHPDPGRPLRSVGRVQARRLTPLLGAYGVLDVVSSTSSRCLSTVLPYAQAHDIEPERESRLSEEEGATDPIGVAAVMERIRERAITTGRPVAICGHRPVLPHMLTALDIPDRSMATAECLVAHLSADGQVQALERHRPPS